MFFFSAVKAVKNILEIRISKIENLVDEFSWIVCLGIGIGRST